MRTSKIVTSMVLFLLYGLTLFFLFFIPDTYTNSIWVMLIFDSVAFISQLALWMTNFGGKAAVFYKYPAMTISTGYLSIQFILCIISAFTANVISFKLALVLNVLLLVIAWILLILTMFSVKHIQKVEIRQNDHHIKLQ